MFPLPPVNQCIRIPGTKRHRDYGWWKQTMEAFLDGTYAEQPDAGRRMFRLVGLYILVVTTHAVAGLPFVVHAYSSVENRLLAFVMIKSFRCNL
jgi:hypothetical protein